MNNVALTLYLPYLLLALAIFNILLREQKKLSQALLFCSLLSALIFKVITWQSLFFLVGAPIFLFFWVHHFLANSLRVLSLGAFLVACLYCFCHWVPGVDNILLLDQVTFSNASAPFKMHLNFDKVFLAASSYLVLPGVSSRRSANASLLVAIFTLVVAVLVLMPIALFANYIAVDFKWHWLIPIWALNNFIFVCFAEEFLFRRFIQRYLTDFFRTTQYGDLVAVVLAATLFGLAHYAGGMTYILFATLAGLFYGYSYQVTRRLWVPMAVHFGLNMIHMLFFTYPYMN